MRDSSHNAHCSLLIYGCRALHAVQTSCSSGTKWRLYTKRSSPTIISGRKKEPKPKLFGPDFFQWGRGLPRERVGAKKFDTSLETREIKLLGRDIPGFCRDIPGAPEKFEKKKFVFNFRSLYNQGVLKAVDPALIGRP